MKLFRKNPESIGQIVKGNKIDLIALIKTYWFYRGSMAFFMGIIVVVTLLVSLAIPAKFKASTSFFPLSEERMSLGQLGNLASLAGMDLSSMLGTSTSMNSDLYPNVIQSYPFLSALLESEFRNETTGEKTALYELIKLSQSQSWKKKVSKYTIGLPWTLSNWLFAEKEVATVREGEIIVLSEEDEAVLQHLVGCLDISVDKDNGLVSVSVVFEDPLLAAQVAQKALDILQQLVIEYKTMQVRENLKFINERYVEKRTDFEEARKALHQYRDSHRNIITERTGSELQDLEMEYNLASNVYQMLAQQVEQANLSVKKETPVFSVIDPVKVPVGKSSPNVGLNLFFSIVIGGFLVVLVVSGKIVLYQIKRN